MEYLVVHREVIRNLEKIIRKLERNTSISDPRQKMCTQEIEDRIESMVKNYAGEINNISLLEINRLIELFEKCEKINFFRKGLKYRIEATIQNLKKNQIKKIRDQNSS